MKAETKADWKKRPVYMRAARLVDPDTGEMVKALIPASGIDKRLMNERRIHVGEDIRVAIARRRNVGFHRLAHAIGALVVDNVDEFRDLDAHAAFKRLQGETGVCCEESEIDLGPLGKAKVSTPRSIAFDQMDEADFRGLVDAVYRRIAERYWPDMTPDAVEQMVEMSIGG